jgi:hypothetical protein
MAPIPSATRKNEVAEFYVKNGLPRVYAFLAVEVPRAICNFTVRSNLSYDFVWDDTVEGYDFWLAVNSEFMNNGHF